MTDGADGAEGEILKVFEAFFANIRSRQAAKNLALYSGDEDCCLIGSDAGEETFGMDGLKSFFGTIDGKPSGFDFRWESTRCTVDGSTGWVFAQGSVSGGGLGKSLPYSLTCIFVRRNGSWLMRHFHGSEPR